MSAEKASQPSGARRIAFALVPLVVFAGLATVFLMQLLSGKDTSVLPSALLGRPAPELKLAALDGAVRGGKPVPALTSAAIRGKLTLVNVWASWCVPCRQEHPIVLGLSQDDRLNIVGINYKDRNDAALGFLGELGNPFQAIGVDPKGAAAIDWGVYGIPESFLVSPDGVILYKHVGPFDDNTVQNELLPAVEKALEKK
jgi:cytochrome c biogenesis protein CcmG/thiol:disulfide interchange protein DsbE